MLLTIMAPFRIPWLLALMALGGRGGFHRALLVVAFLSALAAQACGTPSSTVSGRVVDDAGRPVGGATVRVKTTATAAITDGDGHFTLVGLEPDESPAITAWRFGYYIGGGDKVGIGAADVEIVLRPIPAADDPAYVWLPSTSEPNGASQKACDRCHASAGGSDAASVGTLPVDEWLLDAHARTATNPRFLGMYLGRDTAGNQSPPTRYATNRDYGSFPLPPDPRRPYYGPGYKLDFPATAGNCGACHLPAAAVEDPYGVDPTTVTGVAAEGIPCDFCHKVVDVRLDPDTRMPVANRPGVLSLDLRRPPPGRQLFAGPLDDVAPGDDTSAPVQRQSQFCAACHVGVFWDTVVYNSYGEWLASPYSDPVAGQTCQDCHMPPTGNVLFTRVEAGGEVRDPATVFSHRMPGAADAQLLQNAVTMTATARREGVRITVTVAVTNDKTGHHVPTDSPMRQLILHVRARDASNADLVQAGGPVIPAWGGTGPVDEGGYAGRPGTAYARILEELWTGVSPTAAYWNPTRVVSDNRLAAFATDETTYGFTSAGGPATVEVVLLYRRVFAALNEQKGWDLPDIVMERMVLEVAP